MNFDIKKHVNIYFYAYGCSITGLAVFIENIIFTTDLFSYFITKSYLQLHIFIF